MKEFTMKPSLAGLKEHRFDPIRDSQHIFRELMMALAFPGKPRQLKSLDMAVTPTEVQYGLQPLLTLLDLETVFHVHATDPGQQQTVTDYLSINTNSRPEPLPQADFVLCLGPTLNGRFSELKKGSLPQPNDGATVFYLVEKICADPNGAGALLTLEGPGVRDRCEIRIIGLSPAEVDQWALYRRDYPMGIDIYLISRDGSLIGIPRSVEVMATTAASGRG
jgi:alpha-D-ribose 1-methylphosphonate 5-triphosphate synthase subunit PhnH